MTVIDDVDAGGAWGEYSLAPSADWDASADRRLAGDGFGPSNVDLDGLARWDGLLADPSAVWQLADADLQPAFDALARLVSRARAAQARLLVEWQQRCPHDHRGWSVAEQLHATSQITLKQSRAMVAQAEELTDHPAVLRQVEAGAVSYEQAVAAVTGLAALPDDLDAEQRAAAEAHVVEHMAGFDPVEIRRLTRGVVAIVAPELADERAADFLERQERQAHRDRYLTWASDGHGSVVFRGQLPDADAEPLIVALRALSHLPRGVDSTINGTLMPTRNQRHADALVRLVSMASQCPEASLLGGSRPRVHVTVSLDQLRDGLGAGALDHTGQPVSPGRCRQLSCDAELIPIVLGGASEPLDVGRAHRLVTAPLRAALHARDGGCVFAGCDRPSRECDAHHLVPWWTGGRTSLSNLVLVCPHHHGMIEPARDAHSDPGGRWRIQIAADGIPETIPPRQVDPEQVPIRHARHRIMQLAS